jgi:hypothetical protein
VTDYSKQLAFIAECETPRKLRSLLAQAKASGISVLEEAAFARLIALEPQEEPGSLEYDFLRTTEMFEQILGGARQSPLRQKVAREGISAVLLEIMQADGISEDTRLRLEHGAPELTSEALVLRHPKRFGAETLGVARDRLADAGVNFRDL